jgi:hypothetical protein
MVAGPEIASTIVSAVSRALLASGSIGTLENFPQGAGIGMGLERQTAGRVTTVSNAECRDGSRPGRSHEIHG